MYIIISCELVMKNQLHNNIQKIIEIARQIMYNTYVKEL